MVIFTSDHGDCLGDHGHIQKWTMYDAITRVPCIIWSPNRFAGGRRIDDLVQWFDLGPTILELAGCEPDPNMEARSLLPALEGGRPPEREYVFTEQGRDDGSGLHVDLVTAIRSRTWKLVHFLGVDEGQLFDLEERPARRTQFVERPGRRADSPRTPRCPLRLATGQRRCQRQLGRRPRVSRTTKAPATRLRAMKPSELPITIRGYESRDQARIRELTVEGFDGVSIDQNADRAAGPGLAASMWTGAQVGGGSGGVGGLSRPTTSWPCWRAR